MKKQILKAGLFTVLSAVIISCGDEKKQEQPEAVEKKTPVIKEEVITYQLDTLLLKGYMAYDEADSSKRPVVLVVHEWWGINDYTKRRVKQLAELGYVAMAVDMYGNGATADNPTLAGQLATPFYKDPAMAKTRFEAGLAKAKSLPNADTNKIAAIGYCFGGAQVINMAKLGVNLKGVVSFHGNLAVIPPDKALLKTPILVCHGAADPLVPESELALFKRQMDSVGASYTVKAYEGATHAFTNPNATDMGKKFNLPIAYQAAADSSSWEEMKLFFGKIFK